MWWREMLRGYGCAAQGGGCGGGGAGVDEGGMKYLD